MKYVLSEKLLYWVEKRWQSRLQCLIQLATTALRASAARSGSEGIRHFKIRFWNFFNFAQITNASLPNFEKIENVWQSGKFWQGDWKSMQIWPILRRRLNKYENLATFDKWIEKVWRSGMWGSRRFFQIFILILSYVRRIFHVFQKFILFLPGNQNSYFLSTIII